MKSLTLALASGMLAAAIPAAASGLVIETSAIDRKDPAGTMRVTATVSWRNSWRTDRNHDAVWLFAKAQPRPGTPWRHQRLAAVRPADGAPVACEISTDGIGAFCFPSDAHRGDISAGVTIDLAPAGLSETDLASSGLTARVFGIEMVYIPAGSFSVGNPDPRSADRAAFYRAGPDGAYGGPYRIESEEAIEIGPREGALHYQAGSPQYEGDGAGPIPEAFPKGTRAFYVMKYEITQGDYATFLNTLSPEHTFFRAPFAGVGYYDHRGTIRLGEDGYVAGAPQRPANWISWDDGAAFADWAGLRPMTELEFTKAARGPVTPTGIDYPWGSFTRSRLKRTLQPSGDLLTSGDADEGRLTDDTRDVLGASYYWVMDLAGSVWERVVSAGHPAGRAFRGTHGDGRLRAYGMATNDDWPSGDHNGGGYGYKGGGYYEMSRELARMDEELLLELNPHSPIDWRNYAAWGAAPRSVAYGFRAARTADE